MGIFSCCLCGDKPGKEDADQVKHKIQPEPAKTQVEKEATPTVQPSDDDGARAPCTFTELLPADEEQPLQLVAGRLAKHLLERQPSKTKKLQSASFGGAAGQRWVSNLDGTTVEGSTCNGNTATGGLLLQEVKPLYDPVAGPSTSRLGGIYGSLTSQVNVPHSGAGGHQSGSMNFARSVNRLSAINTSGAFSRRASLLDMEFTKASLQLALGSSLLRGSIAGGVSTHGAQPEPWMLQNLLRQMTLPPPPPAAATHPIPYLLPSGPLGHNSFMPSSLPATASVMATIAAGLGQNPSNAGRPSCDRENSRSSYSQIHAHSPAATHGQHALHPQQNAYPVPLFSRAVCERAEGLPAPLVVLALRSAAAAAGASDGGGMSGFGTSASPGLGHGEEGEQSEAVGRRAASTGCSNLNIGDDCDGGVSWPVPTPTGPVVTSMKLDMPTLQQIEAKRHTSHASHILRPVSGRQPSNPSQASHPGDAEAEARQRAYACLVSALEEAAGRQVALVHAWHNAAAGALLTTAATIAAATATTGGVPTGGSGDSQESQCNVSDGGVAAAAAGALAEEGEVGVVLWGLRELFDQDPCLPLLARDLLRQAAIRPDHVPPLTHSLAPSAYSGLLAGRDPFSAVTMAAAGPITAGPGTPGGGVGNRRVIL
ncbi:hypothetical protein Vretifemale_4212, partial [Volvox reticuliferus]